MSLPVEEFTCHDLIALVTQYLEGTLRPADVQRFEKHLEECPYCRTYVSQMQQTIALLGRLTEEAIEPVVRDELLDRFRDWKRTGSPGKD